MSQCPPEATSSADWEATILRLGLFLPTGFSVMSFAPIAAFEAANLVAGERFYDLRILSETGTPLANSLGWTMNTEAIGEDRFDTLMVGSGPDLVSPSPRRLLIPAFRDAAARCKIRSRSNCIGLCKAKPSRTVDG